MNSNEREPTIKTGGESLSIFEIMQRYRNDGSCEYVIQDALRHFSQLDSQAVDDTLADLHNPDCFFVTHNGKCDCPYGPVITDAATRMRDRCVEKVKLLRNRWESVRNGQPPLSQWRNRYDAAWCAANEIITALESLTLEAAANSVQDGEGESEL